MNNLQEIIEKETNITITDLKNYLIARIIISIILILIFIAFCCCITDLSDELSEFARTILWATHNSNCNCY